MHILDVIPIARGIGVESLSYFSKQDIPAGSLIQVPLRSKEIPALVIKTRSVEESKTEIKSAEFSLKKIKSVAHKEFLDPAFIRAAEAAAEYFATTLGSVLYALLPEAVLSVAAKLERKDAGMRKEFVKYKIALQSDRADRFSDYRSIIREEFASASSVFFAVPTIADAEYAFASLSKGVEQYAYVLHSSVPAKDQRTRLIEAWNENHPVLIIATPAYLSAMRSDTSTIILEHESAESWRTQGRPHMDMRYFAEAYAEATGARIAFGDSVLSTETLHRHKEEEIETFGTFSQRIASGAKTEIIDMKKEVPEGGNIPLIGEALRELIEETVRDGERIFLFCARRGLAPIVVCNDCGSLARDPYTGSPLSLFEITKDGEEQRWFISQHSGYRERAYDACKVCSSWRLKGLGIGIQSVREILETFVDPKKITVLDRESVKNHEEAQEAVASFYNIRGGILLGTALAIPYLSRPLRHAGVVSADSLLSSPSWHADEDAFSTLMRIREIARERYIIQTRREDMPLFEDVRTGSIADFHRNELATRKQFGYPPFGVLVKITAEGTKESVEKAMKEVKTLFERDNIEVYAPPVFPRGKYALHGLIKIPAREWPSPLWRERLLSLPPSLSVAINPDELF